MKFVLATDSFKGTMSSTEICQILSDKISEQILDCHIVNIPMADGGEGTVDCFLSAMEGEKVEINVKGPLFEPITAYYGLFNEGRTAVIEMAVCAGLPLIGENKDPFRATTYGVGQMISDAISRGCKKIIIGLGGSCTNDGGTGMAAALGVKFLHADGTSFIPTGGTLDQISSIDMSEIISGIKDVEIVAMCDVDNPLHGENGAAYIFALQKGATEDQIITLDKQLRYFDHVLEGLLNKSVGKIPGAGAAGGMGAGILAFLGGRLDKGTDVLLDIVGYENHIKDADLVITGEGKIDRQSLGGKVVIGVAKRTKPFGVPVLALVGDIGENIDEVYDIGVCSVISINRKAVPFEEAKKTCRKDLALTFENVLRLYKAFSNYNGNSGSSIFIS